MCVGKGRVAIALARSERAVLDEGMCGDLFVELGEDDRHFGHDLLGVLHAARGGLERLRNLLLELLLGLALEDHLLERAGELPPAQSNRLSHKGG